MSWWQSLYDKAKRRLLGQALSWPASSVKTQTRFFGLVPLPFAKILPAPLPKDGSTQAIGQAGEKLALQHLQQHGLQLLQKNFRCRRGEIDLIMQDGEQVVFVEVRLRCASSHGGAAASVGPAKQKKLLFAAKYFLQRYGNRPPRCRFDVVAIEGKQLQWLRDTIHSA